MMGSYKSLYKEIVSPMVLTQALVTNVEIMQEPLPKGQMSLISLQKALGTHGETFFLPAIL